ncbi:hypothetical protein [Thermococcus sp.]
MTGLEEIEVLIGRGFYEDALKKVHGLKDPLEKVQALISIAIALHSENGDEEWVEELLYDAKYLADKIKNPHDRVVAYGIIASACRASGRSEEGVGLFEEGMDIAIEIENPIMRSRTLASLAYYLAVSGLTPNALEVFEIAFDTIVRAEMEYTHKVDYLIEIAGLLEKAGDQLKSKEALAFYRRAYDIFDKLHVSRRAISVERKARLASMLIHASSPEIRNALFEGKNRRALALTSRGYSGVRRVAGLLEVALWLKRMESPEYSEAVEEAFSHDPGVRLSDAEVKYIAKLLTELGDLEKALMFATRINDSRARSEALAAVAVELARGKRFKAAHLVADRIPEEAVREKILREIISMEKA